MRTDWYVVAVRWLINESQAFAHATRWLRSREPSPDTIHRMAAPRVSEGEYLQNVNAIVQVARKQGASVLVMGAPYRDRVTNPTEAELMIRYRSSLRSAMKQQGIAFLEIRELTEVAYPANQGWFGELIHPNHMGHRLMAAEILKVLEADRLLNEVSIPKLTP